jgi:hypothetical protein
MISNRFLKGLFADGKRWVVRHGPLGHLAAHRETQKDFRWNTLHSQGRFVPKAKPTVEGWLTNQNAALRPQVSNRFQSFVDECLTDSLPLVTKGVIGKCGNQDLPDGIVVAGCFRTDKHVTPLLIDR